MLEAADDEAGLARVWYALGTAVAAIRGRNEDWAHAAEHALARYPSARWHPGLHGLPSALLIGPRPAEQALAALDAALPANPQPWPLLARACLLGMLGRHEEAWAIGRPAAERANELRGGDPTASVRLAELAEYTGDGELAARYLRHACELLEARGALAFLSTYAPQLGRTLCRLGRFDEVDALAARGRELGAEEDAATQAMWRQARALVLAHQGDHAEAERLAREAVEISERTDALNWQGDAFRDLAVVLAAAARATDATTAFDAALGRYERKQNLATAALVRAERDAAVSAGSGA